MVEGVTTTSFNPFVETYQEISIGVPAGLHHLEKSPQQNVRKSHLPSIILLRMLARQRQMLGRRLQRMQMPFTPATATPRPDSTPRSSAAPRARVQPQSALGRDAQLAWPGGKAVDNRSTLLNTFSIARRRAVIWASSSSPGWVASCRCRMRSARSISCQLRAMPMLSTVSRFRAGRRCRRCSGTPSIWISCTTLSRVVPAMA